MMREDLPRVRSDLEISCLWRGHPIPPTFGTFAGVRSRSGGPLVVSTRSSAAGHGSPLHSHLDEAGFAPTLPTNYTWSRLGKRHAVPYEAPQGRRVKVLAAYFTHGPEAGRFIYRSFAAVPKSRAKGKGKGKGGDGATSDPGSLHAERLVSFLWELGGRPADAPADWKRETPLEVWLDNYSVHKGKQVQAAAPELNAARIHLHYLSPYSPELSGIEPIWQDLKYREMPVRSHPSLAELHANVDAALASKATKLAKTTDSSLDTASRGGLGVDAGAGLGGTSRRGVGRLRRTSFSGLRRNGGR